MINSLEENKDLSKFEKEFLSELLNDIEKRENSSWAKSWEFIESQNAFTGHKYSGLNALYLALLSMTRKFEDPRFATFNQARQNGYHIQKGSRGIPIQFFTFINRETKKPWNEKEFQEKTKNMTPEEKRKELDKKIAIVKNFHVFNASNIISNENKLTLSENIPLPKFDKKINTNEVIDEFEANLIEAMKVGYKEIHSEGAYYTPDLDRVTMPLKEQFNSYEERMAVFLHELGHATGHPERLNRELDTSFGSSNYSKEEMKVEINSVFMSNTLGLNITPEQKENHLLYLDSWGKHIKSDPKEFLFVLKDSLKIKDYMLENGKFNELFLEEKKVLNKINYLKEDNPDIQEISNEDLQMAVDLWADNKELGIVSLLATDPVDNIFVALDNLSNNCNVEEFGNKDLAKAWLNEDLEIDQLREFALSLKIFQDKEFGNDELPGEEQFKGQVTELSNLIPIAYTEVEDMKNLLDYEKQVSYNLLKNEQINILENEYISIQSKENIPIDIFSNDLQNANFEDFVSDHSMNIDRDEITHLLQLTAYTEDKQFIEQYMVNNNIELNNLNLNDLLENKNHILKNIDEDTLSFFSEYNVSLSKEFLYDKDYKHLVDFQLSHYEKVDLITLADDYNLIYHSDIENDPKFQEGKEYSNYKDLWEQNFKDSFINDFDNFTLDELERNDNLSQVPNLLNRLAVSDNEIGKAYNQAKEYKNSIRDIDLDNDGIPDRIDIDDKRNAVQTSSDLHEVGSKIDKTYKHQEEKEKTQQKQARTR
ncbi:zincin-like metallopeptidase domain-containing protein [Senegalia sp. (in: firmicutes)]|uniref:zincin-like metallopeptidase domain-containing protein n=1 Tax=Senegalia sp. (in: firmicutes) TaxID=1924098 RepID=UPI003F994587